MEVRESIYGQSRCRCQFVDELDLTCCPLERVILGCALRIRLEPQKSNFHNYSISCDLSICSGYLKNSVMGTEAIGALGSPRSEGVGSCPRRELDLFWMIAWVNCSGGDFHWPWRRDYRIVKSWQGLSYLLPHQVGFCRQVFRTGSLLKHSREIHFDCLQCGHKR